MIPKNFNDKITTKKGTIGEQLVDAYLKKNNCKLYPPGFDGSHLFDRFCYRENNKEPFIVEVKTKPKREVYPDTGIDLHSYNNYKKFAQKHNIKVYIFFVDEHMGKVYGNDLNILEKETTVEDGNYTLHYPMYQGRIIYFPMVNMKYYFNLNNADCKLIKEHSSRNEKYNDTYNKEINISQGQPELKPTMKPSKNKRKKVLTDDLFFQRKHFQMDFFEEAT